MEYKLSEKLVGAIMQVLNQLPAKDVRAILNQLDMELKPQIPKKEEAEKVEEKKK